MQPATEPPEIFDRRRRRALRERAARRNGDNFLWDYIASELTERLALVSREFRHALIIGPMAAYAARIMEERVCTLSFARLAPGELIDAVTAEEDRLPFAPESFDLIISAGTLDSVNDLPGALVQIRRSLKPDGLFLGHMFGAGSLATLKSVMAVADGDTATAHVHPQIDIRSAADLLSRAGFALPVADVDTMPVRYGNWQAIVSDIRDAGIGNALAGHRRYAGRKILADIDAEWQRRMGNAAKLQEQFTHLFLSGWAPSPDQQKAARRGSGTVSLAAALSIDPK